MKYIISSIIILTFFLSCNNQTQPPIAKISPDTTYIHNVKLIDNYAWLKDKTRKDPDVLEYVNSENEYTNKIMKKTGKLQKKLFHEESTLKTLKKGSPIRNKKLYSYI